MDSTVTYFKMPLPGCMLLPNLPNLTSVAGSRKSHPQMPIKQAVLILFAEICLHGRCRI